MRRIQAKAESEITGPSATATTPDTLGETLHQLDIEDAESQPMPEPLIDPLDGDRNSVITLPDPASPAE